MQFEVRCKKSKYSVFGISAEKWNKHFVGRTFIFDTKDYWYEVTTDVFRYYLPSLYIFVRSSSTVTESDRKAMECWIIYPQYKRRVQ